jgi:hypothetical protein
MKFYLNQKSSVGLLFKTTLFLFVINFNLQAQNSEIEAKTKLFFEAFHKKDTTEMKKLCYEKCSFKTITQNSKNKEIQITSLSTFLKEIHKIPSHISFEERIIDTRIVSDALIAHVWMDYEFYIQGEMSHKGVNSIQWIFHQNEWKILDITDSRFKN